MNVGEVEEGSIIGFDSEGKERVRTLQQALVEGNSQVAIKAFHVGSVLYRYSQASVAVAESCDAVVGVAPQCSVVGEVHFVEVDDGRVEADGKVTSIFPRLFCGAL